MASLQDTVESNRKKLFVVVCLMIIAGLLMFRFYNAQKRENRALRLKILSMSENRRTPKPWTQLTTKAAQPVQANQPTTPAGAAAPANQTTVSQTIDAQDTQTLATRLARRMRGVKGLDEAGIDNNIAIADEIISREPDSYGAYKAKLISLLTKEGKFNQAADENEIEGLLENMAQFNTSNDFIARREAALVSNTNADIQNVEGQLEEVARQRETLESQLSSIDPNSQDYAAVTAQMQTLDSQEALLLTNIDSLENNLNQNRAQVANEDIVEIPFMRMLAHDDYDGVIDNAQAFIDQFPASPSGYYYMVRAMQLQGNKEDALNVIRNATLPPEAQQALLQRLDAASSENPKEYWQKLNF